MNKKIIFWGLIGLGIFLGMVMSKYYISLKSFYQSLGSNVVSFAVSCIIAWAVFPLVGLFGVDRKSLGLWDKLLAAAIINIGMVILLGRQ